MTTSAPRRVERQAPLALTMGEPAGIGGERIKHLAVAGKCRDLKFGLYLMPSFLIRLCNPDELKSFISTNGMGNFEHMPVPRSKHRKPDRGHFDFAIRN